MIIPHEIILPDTPFPLEPGLILLTRRGSEAFGLKLTADDPLASDDHDLMGFVVPPERYYTGLGQWEGAEAMRESWDTVLYEARKGIRLLMRQNVNTLTALWCEEEDVLHETVEGMLLRYNRDLFRHAKLARDTFVGYAYGQMKKMTAFDRPTMERIDALEQRLKDGGIDPQHVVAEPPIRVDPPLTDVATEYRFMRQKYKKAYMGAKRWQMVRTVGYDAKNAAHMIRLLHMGMEYLESGRLNVRRTWDREMLLEIKRGEWELAKVQEYADNLFAAIDTIKNALPESLDEERIERLTMQIVAGTIRSGAVYGP